MRNNNDLSLKDLVHQFIEKTGKQQQFAGHMVMDKWADYVGTLCAQHSQCVALKDGVLKVSVPHASLRFELMGQKSVIIDRINKDYNFEVVKDILFFS